MELVPAAAGGVELDAAAWLGVIDDVAFSGEDRSCMRAPGMATARAAEHPGADMER